MTADRPGNDDDEVCAHGIPYPREGGRPTGAFLCNPDGGNPNCGPLCGPDSWMAPGPHDNCNADEENDDAR